MNNKFRLGLLINPFAGLGGSVALKGSDGVVEQALDLGAEPKASLRMAQALKVIQSNRDKISIITASGDMGEALAKEMGFETEALYHSPRATTAEDTKRLASALLDVNLDLLLFAGGDGTARDIFDVVGDTIPVLGVPAGVKIHSGVYGITPTASGLVLKMLLEGELVSLMSADVMDIDEAAFRKGRVIAKRFGEMQVPAEPRYVQAVKMGGKESNELVLADIAADAIEQIDDAVAIIGSGSTVAAVMEGLGLENTLLGIDVVQDQSLLGRDLSAMQLLTLVQGLKEAGTSVKLLITLIGGQGHVFGRGNQQLSPDLIKLIDKEDILLIATKTKLRTLEGRPLIVDSGDPELDKSLAGYYRVITGYHDYVMYQVSSPTN